MTNNDIVFFGIWVGILIGYAIISVIIVIRQNNRRSMFRNWPEVSKKNLARNIRRML